MADHEDSTRDERLNEIVADYLRSVATGEAPNRQELLSSHPEFADDLRSFFAEHDKMQALADAIPGSLDAPTLLPDSQQTGEFVRDAARSTSSAPPLGTVIRYFGDYELLAEIARGGMGVVYKARQKKLNRIVALKMILAGQLASKADVQRFYSEAEAAANLDHPGIVPIFEVGEHDGQHFFSMGYVDGQSLSHRIADSPLPPREAAELIRSVALAVQYAHDNGVIHRDLKPANILLQIADCGLRNESSNLQSPIRNPKSAIPRITDFGLAKQVKGDSGLTATGQILGTPSYMPPEQAAGRLDQVKETADIYSLGAVLYATLTGRPPFQADNPLDTLLQVLEREPISPRQLNPSVPRDLETICLKCLEKDRRRRYASAQAVADELQRYLNGEPISARRIGKAERTWRWVRRKPAFTALSGLTITALIALVVVGSLFNWRLTKATQQTKELRSVASLQGTEIENLRELAEAAERNEKLTVEKYERLMVEVSRMREQVGIEGIGQFSKVAEMPAQPSPRVTGHVVAIGKNDQLVEISLGQNDGLLKGHMFHVVRQNKYIGQLRIVHVVADRAVGQVIERTRHATIMAGDSVIAAN